jgi:hypothetical protein
MQHELDTKIFFIQSLKIDKHVRLACHFQLLYSASKLMKNIGLFFVYIMLSDILIIDRNSYTRINQLVSK